MKSKLLAVLTLINVFTPVAGAQETFEREKAAIMKMAGCYHVDYNFTEVESLQPDYKIDDRVYDVNKDKTVKEWIFPIQVSATHIRLQHILFGTDAQGKVIDNYYMRHQAEDWEYQPDYFYAFTSPSHWVPSPLEANSGKWVRKITNLDDGPRYQCAAAWNVSGEYPEWKCDNYAPIPGREYRDMKRKDYQALKRSTRIIQYGSNWLERQNNIKTVHTADTQKEIARESGKTWYIPAPISECTDAKAWADERVAFWEVSRKVWAKVLNGKDNFVETMPEGEKTPRFMKIWEVEGKYFKTIANDQKTAINEMNTIIQNYRGQN